jgi:hypothetical protein
MYFIHTHPIYKSSLLQTHHIARHIANIIAPDLRWSLLEHVEGFCDYGLTDFSLLKCKKINVATASVLAAMSNIGCNKRDQDCVMRELVNYCNVGTTTADLNEIQHVTQTLLKVFYKNFPHLAPAITDLSQNVQQLNHTGRTISPSGVDEFVQMDERTCSSPTYKQYGGPTGPTGPTGRTGRTSPSNAFMDDSLSQFSSNNKHVGVQKVTMVVGPTVHKSKVQHGQHAGFTGGSVSSRTFGTSSTGAFGRS